MDTFLKKKATKLIMVPKQTIDIERCNYHPLQNPKHLVNCAILITHTATIQFKTFIAYILILSLLLNQIYFT